MIQHVAVIGAGTMGNGIAHLFAQFGYKVNLIDVNAAQLQNAVNTIRKNLDRQVGKGTINEEQKQSALSNIKTFEKPEDGIPGCELVIEAVSENEELKLRIFKQIDTLSDTDTILASNTSSISISKIASETKKPAQVIGMHFMNPVPVMKLVEIIKSLETKEEVTSTIVDISKKLGKVPCVVNDFPGFIANRILMPMINEAIFSLYQGVAGVEEIDTIMKLGMGHPMGPLQLADFVGLDVCHSILNVLYEGFNDPKYAPCPLLTELVTSGKLGVKSGEGFYSYAVEGNRQLIVSERFKR